MAPPRWLTVTALGAAATLAWAGGGCAGRTDPIDPTAPAERVRRYEAEVRGHPSRYPAWTALAAARLDVARRTLDPAELGAARAAAERSLAIQPSLEGYKLRGSVEAMAHRFAEALAWAERARTAAPDDAGAIALEVEALLALGRLDDARALLPADGEPAEHFHTAASLALWRSAAGDPDGAEEAFAEAARLARAARVPVLETWAWVRAAGVRLDAGEPARAKPHLARAAALAPNDYELEVHRAELDQAEERTAEAERRYRRLLERRDDPEIHRRLFVLARERGDGEAAERHFRAAEAIYLEAVEAGEVYTLDGLARLRGEEAPPQP